MCVSIPPSIPHFGTTFGTTRTMYHLDTTLRTTPSTTPVDQVDLFVLVECITSYLTISLGKTQTILQCISFYGALLINKTPLRTSYNIIT